MCGRAALKNHMKLGQLFECRVGFLNCSCLAKRSGVLDEGKFYDLCSFFCEKQFDILLLAETGVAVQTFVPPSSDLGSDFSWSPRSLPGLELECWRQKLYMADGQKLAQAKTCTSFARGFFAPARGLCFVV